MLRALSRLLKPSAEKEAAHRLYLALAAQSRNPFFYARLEVPDSFDGRFELMALHAFLVLHRLKASHGGRFDAEESGLERALIETLFADLDRALREEGVGDTGVSRRIKKMANALYGRLSAYETGLADPALLREALTRNLYGTATPSPETLDAMAAYVRKAQTHLAGREIDGKNDLFLKPEAAMDKAET